MLLTSSFSEVLCSWISARQIFCCSDLKRVPFTFLFSFVRRVLHLSTLSIAAPSHPDHSRSWLGGGSVPSQVVSRAVLLSFSLRKERSKKWVGVGGTRMAKHRKYYKEESGGFP